MRRFLSSFLLSVVATLALILAVGCGSSNNGNGTAAPAGSTNPGSGTVAPSGSGSGSGGSGTSSGAVCTSKAFAVGVKVLYKGPQDSSRAYFKDPSAVYIGTIEKIFSNGSVEVAWNAPLSTDAVVDWTVLATEAPCTPDVTGKRVLYTGIHGSGNSNFPDAGQFYEGTILMIFAEGKAQIKWDHLANSTVEEFSNFAIETSN